MCNPPLPLRPPWFLNPTVLNVTCFAHLNITWQKPHRKAKAAFYSCCMYLHYSKVLHFICPRIYCFCSWSEGRVESQTEVNELLVYFPVWVWETDKKQAVSAAIENLSWCRCAVSQKPQIQQKYNREWRKKQGGKWSGAKEKNMIYFDMQRSGLDKGNVIRCFMMFRKHRPN